MYLQLSMNGRGLCIRMAAAISFREGLIAAVMSASSSRRTRHLSKATRCALAVPVVLVQLAKKANHCQSMRENATADRCDASNATVAAPRDISVDASASRSPCPQLGICDANPAFCSSNNPLEPHHSSQPQRVGLVDAGVADAVDAARDPHVSASRQAVPNCGLYATGDFAAVSVFRVLTII